jgi:hypothetical protein
MSLSDLFRQLSLLIGTPAVILAAVGTVLIVVPRDWRVVLFGYALLTVMLSLLLSQVVPTEWALQQAVAGGLVAVMLFLSARQLRGPVAGDLRPGARWPRVASLTTFRALAVGLAAVAFLAARNTVNIPLVTPLFGDVVLWLVMIGLVGLALHEEPLHAGLSLLIFLGGAELVIFTLIQRQMLVGILQAGQVLLGLAIAYLVVAHGLATPAVAPAELEPPAPGSGGSSIGGEGTVALSKLIPLAGSTDAGFASGGNPVTGGSADTGGDLATGGGS